MTVEERFERIEHVTAGLAEQFRVDREENRQIWRNTQRQLDELATHVDALTINVDNLIARVGELTAHSDSLTLGLANCDGLIARLAQESRAADQRLENRIGSLVSAIGQFIAGQEGRAPQS